MWLQLPRSRRLDAIEADLAALKSGQKIIIANQEKTMASLSEVQASEAAEDTEIKALITAAQAGQVSLAQASAQIAALQAQIAAGQTVSPSDLDAIKADMDAQASAIGAALAPAAQQAVVTPPSTGAS